MMGISEFIIPVVILFIVIPVGIILCFNVIHCSFERKLNVLWIDNYKILQISITIVSLFVLAAGAWLAWHQYSKQEQKENQKYVIDIYLDKNLDVFLENFNNYSAEVLEFLSCKAAPVNFDCPNFKTISEKYPPNVWFPYSLINIDQAVYVAFNGTMSELGLFFNIVATGSFSSLEIPKQIDRLKPKTQFVIFNLREISKIVREKADLSDFSTRNLNVIRKREDYKKIIASFEEYNALHNQPGAGDKLTEYISNYLEKINPIFSKNK